MSVALRRPMTVDEFLAWEEGQELRWEFDGFEPVAMTGGTARHAGIWRNVLTALNIRLRGKRCQVYGNDLKIRVAGSIRYPDAFVVCTPVLGSATIVTDPVVVFEVLSPSTATTDHLVKNQEYRDTLSVLHYVMLEQDRPGGVVFSRIGNEWRGRVLDADAMLDMPEIDISVPLAELYEGIAFGNETDAA